MMENSATTATEKKECKSSGLDGSPSEIPKKPSPTTLTRGTALPTLNHSGPLVLVILPVRMDSCCFTIMSGTQRCSELKHYSHSRKSLGST